MSRSMVQWLLSWQVITRMGSGVNRTGYSPEFDLGVALR